MDSILPHIGGVHSNEAGSRRVRRRLFQVKRSFVETLCSLVDESFFSRTESRLPFAKFDAPTFRKRLGAAYDLRSRYVHTGISFGAWIAPARNDAEVQLGKPIVGDRDLGKILSTAPTYLGLERVIRYALLRFAEANGVPVSTAPAAKALVPDATDPAPAAKKESAPDPIP